MSLGIGIGMGLGGHAQGQGVGASAFASYPAPAGYRWDFVTFNGERVTFGGVPVVTLVGT